ncbi:MAG: hypothetical protein R3B46_09575 [Phycisphaerales bacterium]
MSPVSGSEWITATTTDKTTNNTSEFSACLGVVTGSGACLGDASGNAVVDVDDLNMILGERGAQKSARGLAARSGGPRRRRSMSTI